MKSFSSNDHVVFNLATISYGMLFVVLLPLLIVLRARGLENTLRSLPVPDLPMLGWFCVLMGAGILVAGWYALMRYGKGLPMNVSPPQHLVQEGIYSIVAHPIYIGFTLMVAGYFLIVRSGTGLWIVTPSIALGAVALVLGYERHDMKKRFGTVNSRVLLHLPEHENKKPSIPDRLSCYLLVYLPWLVLYEAAILLGRSADLLSSYLPIEQGLPVLEWTELIYASTYLFVLIAPLVARRKQDLREFMIMGWCATVIGTICVLLFPLQATPRMFRPVSILGQLLMAERMFEGPGAAFPPFHVIWAFLAAWLYTRSLSLKPLWYGVAVSIAASCIRTGMHSIIDVVVGFCVFLVALWWQSIWRALLRNTEHIANSWKEWRIGRVRVINHGLYPGFGVFLGFIAIVYMTGPAQMLFVVLTTATALLGAGLWGQAIEGSSKLSRPFGYFGGVLGAVGGMLLSSALGGDGWLLAGAFSVAAPFIQMFGRMRCLVQGCCHGRPCDASVGITFIHERSRVLKLANLGHQPIYPTQLYSILYNIFVGGLLIRAWTLAAHLPFIMGAYFLLAGMGRFVEESYRGEPQTPVYAGLAIYHWLAISSILIGAFLMTREGANRASAPELQPGVFVLAALFGLLTVFAMGVDFPESNKRYSRLAQ